MHLSCFVLELPRAQKSQPSRSASAGATDPQSRNQAAATLSPRTHPRARVTHANNSIICQRPQASPALDIGQSTSNLEPSIVAVKLSWKQRPDRSAFFYMHVISYAMAIQYSKLQALYDRVQQQHIAAAMQARIQPATQAHVPSQFNPMHIDHLPVSPFRVVSMAVTMQFDRFHPNRRQLSIACAMAMCTDTD